MALRRSLPVDVLVMEVGLGGRLDASNTWAADVAAITNVGLDHQRVPGRHGRLRGSGEGGHHQGRLPGRHRRLRLGARGRRGARPTGRRAARGLPAPGGGGHGPGRPPGPRPPALDPLRSGLLGRHQAANAAVALGIVAELATAGVADLADAAVADGLARTHWPGRLEIARAGGARPIVLDGAHNPDGAAALATGLDELATHLPGGRAVLLLAIMSDKAVTEIVTALRTSPLLDGSQLIATRVPDSERSLPPAELAAAWTAATPAGHEDRDHLAPRSWRGPRRRSRGRGSWPSRRTARSSSAGRSISWATCEAACCPTPMPPEPRSAASPGGSRAARRGAPPPPALRIRGLELRFGARTYVMGIVNVTPDSFSGDGLLGVPERGVGARHEGPAAAKAECTAGAAAEAERAACAAVEQAVRMVGEGADIIDVGGESTRPGHAPVSELEELARVELVVRAIRARLPDVPLSIDTRKASVAEAALAAGADIINDVAAVTDGAGLAVVAAAAGAPYVLMHSRARPVYADVVTEVVADLSAALHRAEAAGCPRDRLIVDPGIGFGKTAEQNLALLARAGGAPRPGTTHPPRHQPQVHHRQGPRPARRGAPRGHPGDDGAGHRRARGHRARPRRGGQRPRRRACPMPSSGVTGRRPRQAEEARPWTASR